MKQDALWKAQLERLNDQLEILPDKPEETAETTLKALWLTAAARPVSAEKTRGMALPELKDDQQNLLAELIEKRLSGIPLAHLSGRQQFMGVELLAGPQALVPRKETELLGFAALDHLRELHTQLQRDLSMMDVCTGAGNLAVALTVLFPQMNVFAADLSADAVSLAERNVRFHHLEEKVRLRTSDVLDAFDTDAFYESIDVLLCNPPYISSAKVPEMHTEISDHEPSLAFDGGAFGIKVLSKLAHDAPKYLRVGGWLGFEVGLGQGPAMQKRLTIHKQFDHIQPILDSDGHIRALFAQRIV